MLVAAKTVTKQRAALREQLYVHAIFISHQNKVVCTQQLRSLLSHRDLPPSTELLQVSVRQDHIHLLLAYPLTRPTLQLLSEYLQDTGVLKHSLERIERLLNAPLQDCLVRMGGWASMNDQGRVCGPAPNGNASPGGPLVMNS